MEDIILALSLSCGAGFLAEYLHRLFFNYSLLCRLGFHRVDGNWLDDGKGNSGFHFWCLRKGCGWHERD